MEKGDVRKGWGRIVDEAMREEVVAKKRIVKIYQKGRGKKKKKKITKHAVSS